MQKTLSGGMFNPDASMWNGGSSVNRSMNISQRGSTAGANARFFNKRGYTANTLDMTNTKRTTGPSVNR